MRDIPGLASPQWPYAIPLPVINTHIRQDGEENVKRQQRACAKAREGLGLALMIDVSPYALSGRSTRWLGYLAEASAGEENRIAWLLAEGDVPIDPIAWEFEQDDEFAMDPMP
jgi:hypothetical protein